MKVTTHDGYEIEIRGPLERFGFIPSFIHDWSAPVIPQIDENYVGRWNDFEGFDLRETAAGFELHYPDDPAMVERARITTAREIIAIFDYSWVVVYDREAKTHRIARLD